MILGIDASNIRAGGPLTHLAEVLRHVEATQHGFSRVIVWSGAATLASISDRPWLEKVAEPLLAQSADPYRDRRHLQRAYWQRFVLPRRLAAEGCDVLFAPGGLVTTSFQPSVTMSQNMLPFEWREARRYGVSLASLRFLLLYLAQSATFKRATGIQFLTRYAMRTITAEARIDAAKAVVIPHGIGSHFYREPRAQRPIEQYSLQKPFRVLYVSTVDLYKHQWHVAEAVARLRGAGVPIVLDLVGPMCQPAGQRMQQAMARLDPSGSFLFYHGAVAYQKQPEIYAAADLCVFASSCENMPLILLEGMASGVPIASSDRGPMPEVLGDAGVYFDPESPASIADALRSLLGSSELRAQKAKSAYSLALQYSWARCASETFAFLAECARRGKSGRNQRGRP